MNIIEISRSGVRSSANIAKKTVKELQDGVQTNEVGRNERAHRKVNSPCGRANTIQFLGKQEPMLL
ncbi:MAG: hypothetical protein ACFCD0_20405 [Gemmataceae bacterium]